MPFTTRSLLLVAASLCAASCHGFTVRGGGMVAAGHEPAGRPVAVYEPVDCRDASGAAVEYRSRVLVVDRPGKSHVLVETRAGYDSLVIDNSFVDGGDRVFQVVLKSREGTPLLHDLRVPAGAPGPGRLLITPTWTESRRPDGGFEASPRRPSITCRLIAGCRLPRKTATPGLPLEIVADVPLPGGATRFFVASESGVVSIFDVTGGGLRKLAEGFFAPGAHVVGVDRVTHLLYFPLRNMGGRPVLRVARYMGP